MRRLAIGGMAEVFIATCRDNPHSELLVVKRILPHLQKKADFLQMFLDEARLTSQLEHPNLVKVKDFGKAEGMHYIAMEYVDGLSLSRVQSLLGSNTLPIELCCWLVAEACNGLTYAHQKTDAQGTSLKIVHRDISPDNILLSRAGEVKLADFGVAKATLQMARTRPGQIKGKLAYMSPEQAMQLSIDQRSDIFSLGLVLYEITTGRRAFNAPNELGVLRAIFQKELTPPEEVIKNYPPPLSTIVKRALAWDLSERYQQASEMREALLSLIPHSSNLAKELSRIIQSLRRDDPTPSPGNKVKSTQQVLAYTENKGVDKTLADENALTVRAKVKNLEPRFEKTGEEQFLTKETMRYRPLTRVSTEQGLGDNDSQLNLPIEDEEPTLSNSMSNHSGGVPLPRWDTDPMVPVGPEFKTAEQHSGDYLEHDTVPQISTIDSSLIKLNEAVNEAQPTNKLGAINDPSSNSVEINAPSIDVPSPEVSDSLGAELMETPEFILNESTNEREDHVAIESIFPENENEDETLDVSGFQPILEGYKKTHEIHFKKNKGKAFASPLWLLILLGGILLGGVIVGLFFTSC